MTSHGRDTLGEEVYALCAERTFTLAEHFLETYAPDREPLATEYLVPQFSETPSYIFTDSMELIRHLETNRDEWQQLYWRVGSPGIAGQVMLFFTIDGGMIAGLADLHVPPEEALTHLAAVVKARFGYTTLESCPPETAEEFMALCRGATTFNLCEGEFRFDVETGA